ncbi:ferritin-like domain-containing protein [Thermococcus sp.]
MKTGDAEKFSKIVFRLSTLSEKELLSYWIRSEFEKAKTYWKLAKRAKELGLPEGVINTLAVLAKEFEEDGRKLREIYYRSYGEDIVEVDIPSFKVEIIEAAMGSLEDVMGILTKAVEAELLAKNLYEKLALETKNESLRSVYLYLARVEEYHYRKLKNELELCRKICKKD